MIIDSEYDASLWYMIKGGGKNRKRILEFLKEVPEELLCKIRTSLEVIRSNPEAPISDRSLYGSVSSIIDSRIFYSYNLCPVDNSLILSKTLDGGKEPVEIFELMLLPLNLDEIRKYDSNGAVPYEEWIGSLEYEMRRRKSYDFSAVGRERESEYNLSGYLGSCCVKYNIQPFGEKHDFSVVRPVSLKRIPKDITLKDLSR